MHREIEAAVTFLVKILSLKWCVKPEKLVVLAENMARLLNKKYQGHWYPDKPDRGQAYRCIRINPWQYVDESLLLACAMSGLDYSRLPLWDEMTIWIDPFEVCGRFGENTDFFTIASFQNEVAVKEYKRKHSEQTSDYSSDGPSSGTVSENSSDDETAGEKATPSKNMSSVLIADDCIAIPSNGPLIPNTGSLVNVV
ncbi:protein BTG3 [Xenopus laevis]|uniref:Protein BTG3 n=2 Tax=Xenopus laevis TaxID=8355 RepID=A0A8J1LDU8_XENLA|nr:protein BTG3 [Xenopus laevis]